MKILINTIKLIVFFVLSVTFITFIKIDIVFAYEIKDPEAVVLYVSDSCVNCAPLVEKVKSLNNRIKIKQTNMLETQKELKYLCEKEGVKENCGYIPLLVLIKQGKYYSIVGVDNIYDYIQKTDINEYKISSSKLKGEVSKKYIMIGIGIFSLGLVLSLAIFFKEYRKTK